MYQSRKHTKSLVCHTNKDTNTCWHQALHQCIYSELLEKCTALSPNYLSFNLFCCSTENGHMSQKSLKQYVL